MVSVGRDAAMPPAEAAETAGGSGAIGELWNGLSAECKFCAASVLIRLAVHRALPEDVASLPPAPVVAGASRWAVGIRIDRAEERREGDGA